MKSVPLFVFFVLTCVLGGCATNGRQLALMEFQANAPHADASPLQGKSVYVAQFSYEPYLGRTRPDGQPQEPAKFNFVEMTDDQKKLWDAEYRAKKVSMEENDKTRIGNLRNGYGIIMSNVYYLDYPGDWLKHTIELEAQARGATLASSPESADIVVSGDIVWLKIDMYMAYNADLYVNFVITPRGAPSATHTIYTTGSQVAWSTTGFEYYQSLRRALQKSMLILLPEMEQSLKH